MYGRVAIDHASCMYHVVNACDTASGISVPFSDIFWASLTPDNCSAIRPNAELAIIGEEYMVVTWSIDFSVFCVSVNTSG
ncbi:hypothetical protein TNCV_500081 [Trichonephila clavipes]|nr:hypothetical protein TNCV_500081 [Trichonephila clavipes]